MCSANEKVAWDKNFENREKQFAGIFQVFSDKTAT